MCSIYVSVFELVFKAYLLHRGKFWCQNHHLLPLAWWHYIARTACLWDQLRMSQIRSELTGTILTSIDDSHHLNCLTTFFAINVSKRIKLTESWASYGSDCLQDKMSYENNLMMAVFRQSADDPGLFLEILESAASVENVLRISLICRTWNFILNKKSCNLWTHMA